MIQLTMAEEVSTAAGKANNQNTNQNEAFSPTDKDTSIVSNVPEQFHETPGAAPTTTTDLTCTNNSTSISRQNEIICAVTKSNDNFYRPIPTIEITPAMPDDGTSEMGSQDGSVNIDVDLDIEIELDILADQSSNKSTSLNMDFLRPPTVDTTLNIARPNFEDNLNVSRLVDNSNDEDIEVVCRYSSTPVLSFSSSRKIENTDVSMLSITSASPIVPTNISTPSLNNSHSQVSRQNENEDGIISPCISKQKCPKSLFSDFEGVPKNVQTKEVETRATHPPRLMQSTFSDIESVGKERQSCALHDCHPSMAYSSNQGAYYPCAQSHSGYDFHIGRESSWTDLSCRSDLSSLPPQTTSSMDPCCFSMGSSWGCMGGLSSDAEYFVYPSIYVSSAGLISVLLRNDISVEMTVDRTIRVVSHNHMMAVATDSRGTAACLYHPAVKVFQMGTTTDIATHSFRAQMGGNDNIVFSNGVNHFRLEGAELQPTAPMKFIDILRDQSVNLLFSSEGYGETLVASCMQVAGQAEYANLPKGGVIVRINGVKVTQTGSGDVTVVTGAKFIRLSPNNGTTRLGNRFVDIEVEKDWSVKLTRGSHSFVYAKKRAIICNGKMEAGFDENNALKVTNLAPRHPLLAEPTMVRRPTRKPLRPAHIPANACCTPKRCQGPPIGFQGRGGGGGPMGAI